MRCDINSQGSLLEKKNVVVRCIQLGNQKRFSQQELSYHWLANSSRKVTNWDSLMKKTTSASAKIALKRNEIGRFSIHGDVRDHSCLNSC
jgi:hypothetical protein